ncbi:TPA: phage tail assembly protein [Pseudomonas aeruginosa]|nr:phage tail assembly protein [Pseudomonas aeruginosa]HCK4574106.1 phage tail assembly protein [Pseudomonas aeruginosa]HCK4790549.1 phage tail assembly protein [Pseudomonas aeruginosa]HCK4799639.1 phage tail assembly protein [Pseudomonas aeruginosa]HCK5645965.1 phage tail assembly protein [Pseudomonas aeruginosa]
MEDLEPQTEAQSAAPQEEAIPDNVVVLDTPILRGASKIDRVTLRKPAAGELRGLHMASLLQMDVASLMKLLPRISSPGITEPEAAAMDPADLLACGAKISGFLLQKREKAAYLLA